MIVLGILGTGIAARTAMHTATHSLQLAHPGTDDEGFQVVFVSQKPGTSTLGGHDIMSAAEFCALEAETKYFNPAIADSRHRNQAATLMLHQGVSPLSLSDPSTLILPDVTMEPGWLLPYLNTLNSNVRIGKYFHAGVSTTVSHHNEIGDYVTFGHRVACSGNAIIEDHVTICTGAMVMQGKPDKPTRIGEGAVIHANAIIIGDVVPGAHMAGNPAKPVDPIQLFGGEPW
jgi:acetyltransferase-like isoleucine patch superfamily enzyme